MADPNGPYAYRNGDGDNDILRKILNWFNGISSGSKPFPVVPGVAPTSSGALQYRTLAADETPRLVKSGSGNVFAVNFVNPNTTPVYVKFYNVASPTVGTTTPVLTMAVPAGDGVTPGIVVGSITPFFFDTAISFAVVTGLADSSTAAPASDIHVGVTYR